MRNGLFITVEGMDGSGKTTQIQQMVGYLKSRGYEVVVTREPGGTLISEKVRPILLDPANKEMADVTEMLLYAAARAQLVAELVKPSLAGGKMVICDRFVDSSFVYQGFGRGMDLQEIEVVNNIAMDGVFPDVTFFFDINPEIALKRRVQATGADRIEKENMDFHRKTYEGYKKLAALYPQRIKTIDSDRTVEEIFQDVKRQLDLLLES